MTDDATRTIAFVLYPGLTPLDMIVPLQVLASLATADPRYAVTVVAERVEPVISDLPVRLTPEKAFDQVPDPYIVVVPGGTLGTVRAMVDPVLRAYLVAAAPTAHKVASVCSGALILAAAGLLDGRNATTHWAFCRATQPVGRPLPAATVGGRRQVPVLGRRLGRHRHGTAPGGRADQRATRQVGPADDRVRSPAGGGPVERVLLDYFGTAEHAGPLASVRTVAVLPDGNTAPVDPGYRFAGSPAPSCGCPKPRAPLLTWCFTASASRA